MPAGQSAQAVTTPPAENVPLGHGARPPLTGGQKKPALQATQPPGEELAVGVGEGVGAGEGVGVGDSEGVSSGVGVSEAEPVASMVGVPLGVVVKVLVTLGVRLLLPGERERVAVGLPVMVLVVVTVREVVGVVVVVAVEERDCVALPVGVGLGVALFELSGSSYPALQHWEAPGWEYRPAAQSMQADAPLLEKFPLGHARERGLDDPARQ